MEALPADVVEAAALGDLDTIKEWTVTLIHAQSTHSYLPVAPYSAAEAGHLEILSWLQSMAPTQTCMQAVESTPYSSLLPEGTRLL